MSTIYRYAVFVPSSWQNLGPDAHYSQCADGFDTAEEAEAHAQSFGWIDYTIENYDATHDIALEIFYDELEAGLDEPCGYCGTSGNPDDICEECWVNMKGDAT